MRAIDTNVLVRLLTNDEPMQVRASESFTESGAWVSHLVLAEATWVLAAVYSRGPKQVGNAIELLLEHDTIVLQDPDVVAAALKASRSRPSLGFTDCLVLEVARKAGNVPMGTFDRNLGRLEGAVRLK